MILNIVDRRKRSYRWLEITAIFEPTVNDERVKDSDTVPVYARRYKGIGYDEIAKCSLLEAIQWAN